jgi:hypothetical protein
MEYYDTYQISTSADDGVFEITLKGTASNADFEKMMYAIDAILAENYVKEVIIDIRTFEEHIDSTTIYRYAKKHNFYITGVKTAIVDRQEKTSFAVALKNAGVSVERFLDTELARKWIKNNPIRDTWA